MKIFIYIGILFLIFARPVYAYLDPGTGSYLFQILIAGAIGALFFLKDIVRKVKQLFGRLKEKTDSSNE